MKKDFEKIRNKAIMIGLYLSKFDSEALNCLGFVSFKEAFNALGLSIGIKPASLKNYRDEFDPLFPNNRVGWHKRNMREYCKNIYNSYDNLSFDSFSDLIKSFVIDNYEIEQITEKIEKIDYSDSVAKRLITGKAAEEYFKTNYSQINDFMGYDIKDTTYLACGFDFKLSNNENYFCIEVKGLSSLTGSISLTEKEFNIAKELKNQYCLFIVVNFIDNPYHKFFYDPLNSQLNFIKTSRQITQITYSTGI